MSWSEAASIVGVVGAVVVAYWQVRKVQVQYPSRKVQDGISIVDAAAELLDNYRQEVKRLRDDVAALRAELGHDESRIEDLERRLHFVSNSLTQYRRGVDILIAQLRRLGVDPEWTPPHTDPEGTPDGF